MSKAESFEERLKKLCINPLDDKKSNYAQVRFKISFILHRG